MRKVHDFESIAETVEVAEEHDARFVVIYRANTRTRRRVGFSVHRHQETAVNAARTTGLDASLYGLVRGQLKDMGWRQDQRQTLRTPSMPPAANDDREVPR